MPEGFGDVAVADSEDLMRRSIRRTWSVRGSGISIPEWTCRCGRQIRFIFEGTSPLARGDFRVYCCEKCAPRHAMRYGLDDPTKVLAADNGAL